MKTTLNFSPAFHHKLRQVAEARQKPMGLFVEECLSPVLDDLQARQRRTVFDGLLQLEGLVKDGTANASTTIDEYLYGGSNSPTLAEDHA